MTDPVQVISSYLEAPEEPIRCAAARALGALRSGDAAPALVRALLDADPDVRADAMDALVHCARPQDAPTIRRSLRGDPVGEVKTAAVRALARLKDAASIALLRALAQDRCEPAEYAPAPGSADESQSTEVAWEDGSWDDWLDVQVAAITALGDMNAGSAVDDLIRVRADEGGQDLDSVVFAALAKMPGRGVATLLDFLKDGDAHVRRRALAALSRAGRDRVAPLRDRLLRDPSPGVRRVAADCLDAGDAALVDLAVTDPDASVRAAALLRAAPLRPDIRLATLSDTDPEVRAAALEAPEAHPALAGDPELAATPKASLREPEVAATLKASLREPELAAPPKASLREPEVAATLKALIPDPELAAKLKASLRDPALAATPKTWAGATELAAKLQEWLGDPNARLAAASAAALPRVMGAAAVPALRETAADGEASTEARLAALESLGAMDSMEAVHALRAAAADKVRQVRLAALAAAGALTRAASADVRMAARDVLIDALRGSVSGSATNSEDTLAASAAGSGSGAGGGMHSQSTTTGKIHPSISTADADGPTADPAAGAYPRSTLEAIQAAGRPTAMPSGGPPQLPTAMPSDDPMQLPTAGGAARSRRVPVAGAYDVETDIRLLAARVLAECAACGIDEALAEAAESGPSDVRAAAVEAIAQRAAVTPPAPGLEALLVRSLGSEDARMRCAAARGLAQSPSDATPHLIALLDDADASVRAAAVSAVAAAHPAKAAAGFGDPSPLVRRAAVDGVIAAGADRPFENGLWMLVDGGRADTLMDACARHTEVRGRLIGMLSASKLSRSSLRTILDALGNLMVHESGQS